MTSPPSLATLLPELLERIASFSNQHDLLNLRSTCRDIAKASHELFLGAFFVQRAHTFTPYGLEMLIDITAQRELARRLDRITFINRELQPDLSGFAVACQKSHADYRAGIDGQIASRNWHDLHQKTERLALGLLIRIFQNLKDARLTPEVHVPPGDYDGEVHGTKQLLRTLGPHVNEHDLSDYEHEQGDITSIMVLSAITIVEHPITKLSIFIMEPRNELGGVLLEQFARLVEHAKAPFVCLESLTFHLTVPTTECTRVGKVVRALARSEMLKELAIIGVDRSRLTYSPLLLTIGEALASSELHTCDLWLLNVSSADDMKRFLARCGKALKCLVLYSCTLDRAHAWNEVFTAIARDLSLEHLIISDPRPTPAPLVPDTKVPFHELHGADTIRRILPSLGSRH